MLNLIIAHFGLDPQWIFVVCSAITVYGFMYCVAKESPDISMSIFLYVGLTYYMGSFNAMRQFMAISVCMLALLYVNNGGKLIPFCALVSIAVGIHYTSFVFVVVYLIAKVKIDPIKALIATALFMLVIPQIMRLIIAVAESTKYEKYIEQVSFGRNSVLGLLVQLAFFTFASLFYDKKDKTYNLYYWMQLISLWITIVGGFVPIVGRMKYYFATSTVILVPLVFSKMKNANKRLFLKLMVCVFVFAYAEIIVGKQGAFGVIPYQSIMCG